MSARLGYCMPAWYINRLYLSLHELNLTRGETYTFRVFGGNNASICGSYHPILISLTHAVSGGRLLNTLAQSRVGENIVNSWNDLYCVATAQNSVCWMW